MPLPRAPAACFAAALLVGCAAQPPAPALPPASPAMLEAVQRAKPHHCNADTAAFLQHAGVAPERITSLTYANVISSGESARLIGHVAYVGLSDTPDAVLVIRQAASCDPIGAQATGGARVTVP